MLLLLLLSLEAFSQRTILNEQGDTSIVFSTNQAKYLLKTYYAREKAEWDVSILEHQKWLLEKSLSSKDSTIANLTSIITNHQAESQVLEAQIEYCADQLKRANRRTKVARVTKWLYVAGAFAGGVLLAGGL